MQAVILAAGRGKRLHPITATRTKAMVPIVGKPIVKRVMDSLITNGIQNFILVTSPDDEEIGPYFQRFQESAISISIVPQPEPLGMGHALLQAAPHIQGDFLLSSCDNLVDALQIQMLLNSWKTEKPNAILTALQVGPREIVRMGILALDGNRVTHIVEKPSLEQAPSNIGSVPLYIFSSKLLDYLTNIKPSPRGEYELQDSIQNLIDKKGRVLAHQLNGRYDLTTPEDLLTLNLKFMSEGRTEADLNLAKIAKDTKFISPVFIEKEVRIGSHCVIGPNVFIETKASIGDGVQLEDSVVLRYKTVNDMVIGKRKIFC